MYKKLIPLLLAVTMVLTMAVGCNNTPTSSAPAAQTATAAAATTSAAPAADASAAPEEVSAAAGPGSVVYPLDIQTDGKITYWKPISGDLVRKEGISSDNDTEFARGLMERTGLEIDFINPAVGQENEQFNLMIASGDLADIIEKAWLNDYPSGPDDAIRKNLVYDMSETIEEWAPDFLDYIRNTADLDKKFKTDEGKYWGMGFIRGDAKLCVWRGPVVRGDLLDEYGLSSPVTIEDWTNMLTTFRDNGVEYPLAARGSGTNGVNGLIAEGAFCAWGSMPGFFQKNGVVVYGPAEEGFKDTLLLLRGWYADGLIDKNFLAVDDATLNTLVGSGKVGATIGNTGGGIGAWTPVLKTNLPDAKLIAASYPTANAGEKPQFGQKEQDFYQNYIIATVNPKSRNVEACVKLLNYGYTVEGDMYMNYGQEGITYDMVGDYPTMKDEIAKAADNKAEWSYWARSPYNGVMIQRVPYLEQLLVLQEQVDALAIWDTEYEKYVMPPVTQSVEEGADFSRIKTEIDSYYLEFCAKYVMGQVAEDAYENEFLPTVASMGIDDAIALRQAALDRYNSR